MQRLTALAFAGLLALGLGSEAVAQSADELWPNQDGNVWTFDITGQIGGGTQQTIRVARRSGGWAFLEGFEGDNWFWLSSTSGRIWKWNTSNSAYTQILDLGQPVNGSFTPQASDLSCWDGEWTVTDRSFTANTAVGTFNDCVVVRHTGSQCADAGITHLIFAPGVGLVEYGWLTIAGQQTAKLARAVVDGVTYAPTPAPTAFQGGLETAYAIDKSVYELVGATPDIIQVRFKITNNTTGVVDYTYTSGQTFDYVIEDTQGNELYRWSFGRFFILPVFFKQLQVGDELNFYLTIPLKDNNGQPLQAGSYRIRASHKAGGLDVSGTTPFRITSR